MALALPQFVPWVTIKQLTSGSVLRHSQRLWASQPVYRTLWLSQCRILANVPIREVVLSVWPSAGLKLALVHRRDDFS